MPTTPHNELNEAIEDALNDVAKYRGVQLGTAAITRTNNWETDDAGVSTGPVYTTVWTTSDQVKALIDASLDDTSPVDPPADPPVDPNPPAESPVDPPADQPVKPVIIGQTLTSDKNQVNVGDTFTLTGLLNYSDGSTKPVTAYAFGGYDKSVASAPRSWSQTFTALKVGETKIMNSNSGTTATVGVTVKAGTPTTPPQSGAPPSPPPSPPPSHLPPTDPPPSSPLDDAVITGTINGAAVNVTVKPGEHLQLIDGRFDTGGALYFDDGCIMVHNAWVGEGNPYPADMSVSLHIVCGEKVWDTGQITIQYKCAPRPFWVVEPAIKDFDHNLFPNYGPESANASYADSYANADNSLMGPGLINAAIGNEGEHSWLGLLDAYYAAYIANPTLENAAVVRGMSDAGNTFPFHAFDTATGEMLEAYDYPKTSDGGIYRGIAGNPFKKYRSSLPATRSLDQATGHAPSFHVLGAAMYQTKFDKAMLSQWTAYLLCWQANYAYRLPNGPTKFAAEEGARGTGWTTRQLLQAAKFSDQPELFDGWLHQRLADMTGVLGALGPLPIPNAWLPYPTNDSNGWAFAPWQVLSMLIQSLGYCLQLGYTEAQPVFNTLAKVRMDSIEGLHELSTYYSLTFCEGGDRVNGRHATSWAECLQFEAALTPKLAAALQCEEGSQALQDALGTTAPNNLPGDYLGYPTSSTGYAAIEQPAIAYIVDYYTDDPARALACWTKFRDPRWYRIQWDSPKYNIIPRT